MTDEKFKDLIKRAVELRGVKEVARALDTSQPIVKRYMSGNLKPHPLLLNIMAQWLQELL